MHALTATGRVRLPDRSRFTRRSTDIPFSNYRSLHIGKEWNEDYSRGAAIKRHFWSFVAYRDEKMIEEMIYSKRSYAFLQNVAITLMIR